MRYLTLTVSLTALFAMISPGATRPAIAWQGTASTPSNEEERFEAASIKRTDPDAPSGYALLPGGRLDSRGQTMAPIIAQAYGIRATQLVGGPDWMRQERYTIQTAAAGSPDSARVALMLRHLLEDRFKLVAHMEKRELPAYALTVARPGRLGPKLKPRVPPCETGKPLPPETVPEFMQPICGPSRMGGTVFLAAGITMTTFAQLITSLWLNAPVVDRTGLTGQYDVTLMNFVNQWTDDPLKAEASDPNSARLPVAMEEQLGLKLEMRREVQDVLVIERLERPTEN
jgi:uncharacterized protein (TIGR03435 family)